MEVQDNPLQTFISESKELKFRINPDDSTIVCYYGNLKSVSEKEYIDFVRRTGEAAEMNHLGKFFLDFSNLANLTLNLRAAAVNNLSTLVLKKAPFFLIAILKSKSAFENLATQTAMNSAKHLSRKFLDGKMFDSKDEALTWLRNYKIPQEFLKD